MTGTASQRKIRVLIAKPGLDGHDRGAKVVARALRDAGMEVIYTGLRQSPEQIAEAALQEDVDVVGLSVLSGAHMTLFPRVVELLRKSGAKDVAVLGGGIIPESDAKALRKKGLYEVFGPGTSTQTIIETVQRAVADLRGAGPAAKPRPKRVGAAPRRRAKAKPTARAKPRGARAVRRRRK
jgi:methylmalonyl-CoA mutase, C-terminal domain